MGDFHNNGAGQRREPEKSWERTARMLGEGWEVVSQNGPFTVLEFNKQPNQTEDEPNETPNKQG